MTSDSLKFINDSLSNKNIPYEFMCWTSLVSYPYWVGEYTEIPSETEAGASETDFILTGTHRGSWLELENQKRIIEKCFPPVEGKTAILDTGQGIAVFYSNAFPVPAGEADMKRIQINLKIKEWRVN